MSLLGESEKGARSVEGNKKPEIGRVTHFAQFAHFAQAECPLRVSHFAHFASCPLGVSSFAQSPLVSATLHTLHKPSVPSAHFVSARRD